MFPPIRKIRSSCTRRSATTAGTGSYQAQYLQLVDVSAPSLSFAPPQFMTYGTTNTLAASVTPASPVTYSLLSGDTNKVSLSSDKLVINSGIGSVTVRAVVAATADRPAATNQATITFQKAAQTITFGLSPATNKVGDASRTLIATSDSGLAVSFTSSDPTVASFIGNTLYINGPGTATLTASQAGNDNFEAATSVQRILTVTAPSFASEWAGQTPTSDLNGDGIPAMLEYAFGGSPNSNNLGVLPQMARTNVVTNGVTSPALALTVLVRTNDTNLSVYPQASASLASNNWSTAGFSTNSTTNGAPTGFVRRTYIYDAGTNPRAFLRLAVTNSP